MDVIVTMWRSPCLVYSTSFFFFSGKSTLHEWRWLLWTCAYSSLQGGRNAFLLCAFGGHLAIAEYLKPIMEGHLFDTDDDGYTALHWASQEGQLFMVKFLVRTCGFDVKARNKVGLYMHVLLLVHAHVWEAYSDVEPQTPITFMKVFIDPSVLLPYFHTCSFLLYIINSYQLPSCTFSSCYSGAALPFW